MTYGVDYPWTHPKPAALTAAGFAFAMRYLSTDPSKNLTRGEADALAAAGVWSGVVWETTAGRALAGRAAGVADAQAALVQAQACGMPAGRPIYMAVDTDATWAAVQPYFAGASSVLGPGRTGVYGGLRIVQGAAASGLVSWYWQASAWSGGVWDPRAHIRQLGTVTVGGVQCDRNTAMAADFGQWMPGRTPNAPSPAPIQEDDVPLTDDMINSWNSMIWGLKNTAEATQQQLAAQSATISTLVGLLSAQHDGVDTAQVVAAVQQAIAAAVVKVDVSVGTAPATSSS